MFFRKWLLSGGPGGQIAFPCEGACFSRILEIILFQGTDGFSKEEGVSEQKSLFRKNEGLTRYREPPEALKSRATGRECTAVATNAPKTRGL